MVSALRLSDRVIDRRDILPEKLVWILALGDDGVALVRIAEEAEDRVVELDERATLGFEAGDLGSIHRGHIAPELITIGIDRPGRGTKRRTGNGSGSVPGS